MRSSIEQKKRAQDRVARKFPDACQIRGPATQVYNPATGVDTITDGALRYSGTCMLTEMKDNSPIILSDGQPLERDTAKLRVPGDTEGIEEGDIVEITASELDPGLVGLVFTVVDVREASTNITKILGVRKSDRAPGRVG